MCQFYCDISATMSCYIVLLFLFVMPLAYEAQEMQAIELKIEKGKENEELICLNRTFVFQRNVQTIMKIYTPDHIENHDCFKSFNSLQKLSISKPDLGEKNIYIAKVKNLIDTKLKCIFTLKSNTKVECDFEIAMNYGRELLSINNEKLNTPSNTIPSEVDIQYDYFYTPNEVINMGCKQPVNVYGKLKYEFVSTHSYSGQLQIVSSIEVQFVLKAEDDNSYFDCIFVANTKTIARVRMVLDRALKSNFKINGLAIRPLLGPNVSYAYSGVLPNVSCKDAPIKPINDSVGNWKAECDNTTLILNKKIRANGIEIFGLSDEKITFETCQHMRLCIIYYEYTHNEPIELVCTIQETKLNWTAGDNLKDNRSLPTELNVFKRNMEKDDDSSEIKCSRGGGFSTSIVFQYVDKHAVQGFETTATTFGGHIDETTATTNTPSKTGPWTIKQMLIYIGVGVLLIVLMLLLICIIVIFRRRKQLSESKPIYSNLEGDRQPQLIKRDENIYSNQSTSQTDEYAVPADLQTDANPYSVPYTQKVEDLYAKATPKHQRNNPHKEEVKYAVVEFKKTNQPVKRKPQEKSECLYSEIQINEDLNAKLTKNQYENAFNSRYVNSNQTEYAEPAYCEVGAFKN